jgi:hypothetical protein
METLAERPSSSSSFASLLASLTATKGADAAFDDSDLAPDVASLSYESALRAHARYRVADPVPAAAPSAPPPRSLSEFLETLSQTACVDSPHEPSPEPRRDSSAQNQALRSASVTVRLSAEESAQLRRRAAESGLTLSAYLRSCTLEVESLRAQVKQTLAELRAPEAGQQPQQLVVPKRTLAPAPAPPAQVGKLLLNWLRSILLRRRSFRHAVPA